MAQPIWTTPAGSLGSFPSTVPISTLVVAESVTPATSITYTLLSGTLPSGLQLNTNNGHITGSATLVAAAFTSAFTIRATDNLSNIRDRTFSITVSGIVVPQFTTTQGSLLSTQDSTWVEIPIQYSNPEADNKVVIELKEGLLPPGLEIDEFGIIRGYAQPPTVGVTLESIITTAVVTDGTTNIISCVSTAGFTVGRPVIFTGTVFGGVVANTTYYISSIPSSTTFTISYTQYGSTFPLLNGLGAMTATLTPISVGEPTIRTYQFSLKLSSLLGTDVASYSITVINQQTPVSQGGPGKTPNSRIPTILNTRPLTYNITTDPYFGYYIVPSILSGELTTPPSVNAQIGTVESDNYFAFKIIGHDFDGTTLTYSYSGLPLGLVGDPVTGWITGTPILNSYGINNYSFRVRVYKSTTPSIACVNFNFAFNVSNNVRGIITWVTPTNLGTIFNGNISTLSVLATSDVTLQYRIVDGQLPPNLILLANGEITGRVADQPTDIFLEQNATSTFNFRVEAYSPEYSIVQSTKSFTINIFQEYSNPTDILYIKAAPSITDRNILATLLDSDTLIPPAVIYRPDDIYFGKASSVVYEHAFGIYASLLNEYLAAVTQNHYWRNITLGEIKTAVAKNEAGVVIYEVVYSEVIDNLINPQGISIPSEMYWPNPIDLNLGPWYTSVTNIFTSYGNESLDLLPDQTYYTSLTSGYARTLYPNSLFNMRNRVAQVVGQEYDSRLLPLWMTSQQANGSTLGYTQAWVICYTKPGFADTVKNNIVNLWPYTLNQINFNIDRFTVDKSATYNYDKNVNPPAWTSLPSATPVPDPLDSKDFYVLFPRKTILPDRTQY